MDGGQDGGPGGPSGMDTLRAAARNPHRVWRPDRAHPEAAMHRINAGAFVPVHHAPRFRIGREETIFTMGSCFARHIEKHLARQGLDVPLAGFGLPAAAYRSIPGDETVATHGGALNKYSTADLLHGVRRALGVAGPLPKDGFIEIAPGLWHDPQASNLEPGPRERMADWRARLDEANACLRRATVAILTPGQTETWFDTQTGLSLNQRPPPAYIRSLGARLRFRDIGYEQAVAELEETVTLLRRERGPALRVVLTVSPVPTGSTLTAEDAIVAVTRTKAVLRAAVEHVVRRHDFVDYFPSYEMCVSTPRHLAFLPDGTHPTEAMAAFIMGRFAETYIAD